MLDLDFTTPEAWIGLLLGLAIAYATAYLRKRGENLATKRDIDEITRLVEGVKTEFHVLAQREISTLDRRYEALMTFFDAASDFAFEKLPRPSEIGLEFDPARNPSTRAANLDRMKGAARAHFLALDQAYSRLLLAYHRMALLLPPGEASDVIAAALGLVEAARKHGRVHAAHLARDLGLPALDKLPSEDEPRKRAEQVHQAYRVYFNALYAYATGERSLSTGYGYARRLAHDALLLGKTPDVCHHSTEAASSIGTSGIRNARTSRRGRLIPHTTRSSVLRSQAKAWP